MVQNIKKNIPKLYAFEALRWFFLTSAIFVPFFTENGLNMQEILLLQAAFSVVLLCLEIPSGYFSDRVGRKKALVLAGAINFIGWGCYAFADSFLAFLGAEILLAIGLSFYSGTNTALLYDTLQQLKKESQYKAKLGKLISIQRFSEGIGMVVGGLLAVVSLRFPFLWQPLPAFVAWIVALSVIEPQKHKTDPKNPSKKMHQIVKYVLHEHKEIKWLTLLGAFTMTAGITIFWFSQSYFKLLGLPIAAYGFILAALRFSTGFFAMASEPLERKLGRKWALLLLAILPPLGYGLVGSIQAVWGIVFFLIFQFTWGFGETVIQDYVNKLVTSDMRATVLSINSFMGRIFFTFFGPLLGWISDVFSFQQALLIGCAMLTGVSALSVFFLWRHKVL